MDFFRHCHSSLKTLAHHQGQEAAQEGIGNHRRLETVSGLDQRQAAVQAESRLRVGGRAADSGWDAEAGRVFGGDRGGDVGFGFDGEITTGMFNVRRYPLKRRHQRRDSMADVVQTLPRMAPAWPRRRASRGSLQRFGHVVFEDRIQLGICRELAQKGRS
jgi:hypothetical protein